MNSEARTVSADVLTRYISALFIAAGMTAEHAYCVAEVLVWADLRDVPSHGVSRVPRYLEMLQTGEMNPSPRMAYTCDGPVVSILDADRAAGPVAMNYAMKVALTKSETFGASITLVRATTHVAALGYYTRRAADAGALAIAFAASGPNMAYHGAGGAGVSTSPISIAAPGKGGAPIVFDMGTGAISLGKLAQLARSGRPIPAGLSLDGNGRPTSDPAHAKIPLPMAGPKGSGLALMIEILTSILVANPILADALDGTPGGTKHRQNAMLLVLDIKKFCDLTYFVEEIGRLVDVLTSLPREAADVPILMPGERGDAVYRSKIEEGVSLSPRTLKDLVDLARKYRLPTDALPSVN